MYRSITKTASNKRVFGACLLSFMTVIAPLAAVAAAVPNYRYASAKTTKQPSATTANPVTPAEKTADSLDAQEASLFLPAATAIPATANSANSLFASASAGVMATLFVPAVEDGPNDDAPTLTATGLNPTYLEGAPAADLFSTVTASTVDVGSGQTFTSMLLTVSNVTDGADEILRIDGSDVALTDENGATTATNGLGVDVSVVGTTATVRFFGAALSEAGLQTLVDGLSYRNASANPTDANRTVTITQLVDSGSDVDPNVNTAALAITSIVNVDPGPPPPPDTEPTLTATGVNPTFTEGGAAVDLFSAVTASTQDAGQTFTSMTLTVSNVTGGANEILSFDGSDVPLADETVVTTATNGLTVGVDVAGTTATVRFLGAALSVAQLQTLVDGLTYRDTGDNPGNRTVTITQLVDSGSNIAPSDNTAALNIISNVTAIPINDPPVLDLDADDSAAAGAGYRASFVPGGAAVPVTDTDVSITDPDDTNIELATITLTNAKPNDSLAVNGALPGGIASLITFGVGTITVALSNSATLADYQAALRQIEFSNSSATPDTADRIITVVVNDGSVNSNTATATITFAPNTLVVTKTADTNGTCQPNDCSLREAINAANLDLITNTIMFNIPVTDPGHVYYKTNSGAGVALLNVTPTTAANDSSIGDIDPDYPHSWWSIRPLTPLPEITAPVVIDGYSQRPCAAPNVSPCSQANTLASGDNAILLIELNGASAMLPTAVKGELPAQVVGAALHGLVFAVSNGALGLASTSLPSVIIGGGGSTVQGLVINRFSGNGIGLLSNNNTVSGNFIGTEVSGTLAVGNQVGILIGNSAFNGIGGCPAAVNPNLTGKSANIVFGCMTTVDTRNLISGNTEEGIEIYGETPVFGANNNSVQGNWGMPRREVRVSTPADCSRSSRRRRPVTARPGNTRCCGGRQSLMPTWAQSIRIRTTVPTTSS